MTGRCRPMCRFDPASRRSNVSAAVRSNVRAAILVHVLPARGLLLSRHGGRAVLSGEGRQERSQPSQKILSAHEYTVLN